MGLGESKSAIAMRHAHWLKEEEQLTPFGLDYFSEANWNNFGQRFDEIICEELDSK